MREQRAISSAGWGRWRTVLRALFGVACWAFAATWASAANPIQTENAKAGTSAWLLANPSQSREIEGYASLTSVNRGGSISLFVNTASPSSYTIDVYRLGWYGGAGARQVLGPVTRTGVSQPIPAPDADGLIECAWTDPYTISVPNNGSDPTDWASGVYLAKLTESAGGKQSYIIFTVRDDARPATYVFQSSVNTWQAYNNWGGKSTYDYQSLGGPAYKVSFNRPYARNSGTGDFLGSPSTEQFVYGWEINMLRFLEREGYDVTYVTGVDLHEKGASVVSTRKAFLSIGHDEYWTYQMKQALHQARDQGRHLGFFSGNAVYWQVRYEPSKVAPAAANRTMVAYKEAAQDSDPYWAGGVSANNKYTTTRFRDLPFPPYNIADPIAQPENGLIGGMFQSCCYPSPPSYDMVVSDAQSWVFGGTGVANGTRLTGLLGYEIDAVSANGYAPSGLKKIAESTVPPDSSLHPQGGVSNMTVYSASSGSVVFAAGSIQWAWGLDDFNAGPIRPAVASATAQTATRNVLARFATSPLPALSNLSAAANGANIKLNWTQPAGAAFDNLYRATSAAGPYSLLRTITATTSYVDTSVAKKTTYYYFVTSLNGSVESGASNQASATSK
jgi:hypothetical protein